MTAPRPEKSPSDVIDYRRFKEIRDDYRESRQERIPRPMRSMVFSPDGERLHHHTALREPRDLLWIPEELQAPGVIDQYGRRTGPAPLNVAFVVGIPAELRELPVSVCSGTDDGVLIERSAAQCRGVETLRLPQVPAKSAYWVGLRIDAEIPLGSRRHVRAVIISTATQRA